MTMVSAPVRLPTVVMGPLTAMTAVTKKTAVSGTHTHTHTHTPSFLLFSCLIRPRDPTTGGEQRVGVMRRLGSLLGACVDCQTAFASEPSPTRGTFRGPMLLTHGFVSLV